MRQLQKNLYLITISYYIIINFPAYIPTFLPGSQKSILKLEQIYKAFAYEPV